MYSRSGYAACARVVSGAMRHSLFAFLVLLLISAEPVAAQARSVTWNRYDVALDVQSDGSLQVSETQTIQFDGTFQQGYRLIPTDRVTSIDSVSVSEVSNGQTTAYRQSSTQAINAFRSVPTDQ